MKGFLVLAAFVLVYQPCTSRPTEEESVVSVYTTLPSTSGSSPPLDVYRQIAGNIAERIAQPIYRLFGFANSTNEEKTTKRPFEHIELDSSEKTENKTDVKTNEIPERDIEEVSLDSLQKSDKKPEKFTLFSSLPSSYLPVGEKLSKNETKGVKENEIDDDSNDSLELDDVESDDDATATGREGPFVYVLELMGSVIQLLWGGFLALFKPSTSSS